MPLVWVTGVSGTGKSSVAAELRARGHDAVDADDLSVWVERVTGAVVPSPPHRGDGWVAQHAWVIAVEEVEAVAATDQLVFLCGAVANEREVWDAFDGVVCLVADEATLRRRLAQRTNNDFGRSAEELELVLGWNCTAEADYRSSGATIVDATLPLPQVVDAVLAAAM